MPIIRRQATFSTQCTHLATRLSSITTATTDNYRQWNAVGSLDDGHKDARNTLRYYWLPINHYLLHLAGFSFSYLSKMHGHSNIKFSKRERLNTLWTGDADLRLYITTVQDGWRKSAFLTRAWFPRTIHLITQYMEHFSEWSRWRMFIRGLEL